MPSILEKVLRNKDRNYLEMNENKLKEILKLIGEIDELII